MHREAARQARGARLELAGKVHTHWKRKTPIFTLDLLQALPRGGGLAVPPRAVWLLGQDAPCCPKLLCRGRPLPSLTVNHKISLSL